MRVLQAGGVGGSFVKDLKPEEPFGRAAEEMEARCSQVDGRRRWRSGLEEERGTERTWPTRPAAWVTFWAE